MTVFDCSNLFDATKSGVYTLLSDGYDVKKVYCDMETDGGG